MKIVFASNVLVAAFATRGLCTALFEHCIYEHTASMSEGTIKEVAKALRAKAHVPQAAVSEIEQFLRDETHIVIPTRVSADCRDPSDLHILGAAVAAGADYLVSGDNDLLTMRRFHNIPIITPRQLWELLQQSAN
jgi:uncharacterized protein